MAAADQVRGSTAVQADWAAVEGVTSQQVVVPSSVLITHLLSGMWTSVFVVRCRLEDLEEKMQQTLQYPTALRGAMSHDRNAGRQ
jgi:hypothetical protein